MATDRIIKALKEEISGIKDDLREMKELLLTKDERIDALECRVVDLVNENVSLKKTQDAFLDKLDASEAYGRRDTVILSGDVGQPTPDEDAKQVTIKLVHEKLGGFVLKPDDISVAHRLQTKPRTPEQTNKPPNMYVKLCRRDLKAALMKASKQQPKNSSNGIFINESLTPTRTAIRNSLMTMKRSNPSIIKGVTSQEGVVIAFTPAPAATAMASRERLRDLRHRITTRAQLEEFCETYIKKPLDQFILSWPQV